MPFLPSRCTRTRPWHSGQRSVRSRCMVSARLSSIRTHFLKAKISQSDLSVECAGMEVSTWGWVGAGGAGVKKGESDCWRIVVIQGSISSFLQRYCCNAQSTTLLTPSGKTQRNCPSGINQWDDGQWDRVFLSGIKVKTGPFGFLYLSSALSGDAQTAVQACDRTLQRGEILRAFGLLLLVALSTV